MSTKTIGINRREFIKLSATGAAAVTLGGISAFAAVPKRGGTVTCGMSFLIQTPDPHRFVGTWARQCSALGYEGLTTPTSRGERVRITKEKGPEAVPDVRPMLADSWEIEKGGTRYVFHLKKGVKFHNGKEFGSEDVKWNWERIKDPLHKANQTRKLLTLYLKSIETPDRYTIVANLDRPYGAFPIANAWCNTCILPKDSIPHGVIWGYTPTFKPPTAAPPGTGPFQMVEFQQKHQAVFKAHKDYRIPGLPYLDKVIYKVISKDAPRTMALRAGNLDYIYGAEANWLSEKIKGKKIHQLIHLEKEGLQLFPVLGSGCLAIYLNSHDQKDTPFKDARVRQAFDYCIDREKLAKTLYGDLALPAVQGYTPGVSPWGYPDIMGRKRDIEKAKKLLKEAGYPNGLDVEFKITPTWGRNDIMAQIVQQMAKPAGFRIKIVSQVGVQYWLNLRKYSYHMLAFVVGAEDPMNYYYSYMHTDATKAYGGYAPVTGIKDAAMDKLLDEVASESDFKKRRAEFKKVVLRSNEQAYIIPYLTLIGSNAWTTKLNNFKPWDHFISEQAFREAWIEG